MSKIPKQRDSQVGKPGRIDPWPSERRTLEEIADSAYYRANGKHKNYYPANGEWIPARRGNAALCDKYPEDRWTDLSEVLKEAIRAGCVQIDSASEYPVRVWAFIDNTLHEARRTNPEGSEYHGFPLVHKSSWPIDRQKKLEVTPRVNILTD